jgi:hypothetical protein
MRARRAVVVDERTRNKRRAQFLLLAALFMAPVIAAWVAWKYMGSHGVAMTTNAGTLISPARSIEVPALSTLDREPLSDQYLRGRWTYVIFVPESGCGEECQRQIFYTRQVRTSVNKDMFRVQRLLVTRRQPGQALVDQLSSEHSDLQVALVAPADWSGLVAQFRIGSQEDGVQRFYLVDPLGNLMMAYEPGVPPKGVLKDLRKLLKISQIG